MRIEEGCRGTLLAKLAANPRRDWSEDLWDEPDALGAIGDLGDTVRLACRFSLHVEGIALLYNLMLAEERWLKYKEDSEESERWAEDYAEQWQQWAEKEAQQEPFDGDELWEWLARREHRYARGQQRFIDGWTARLGTPDPTTSKDDFELRKLIADREYALKGKRSRLKNAKRLLHWSGRSGVGRMQFNWPQARQMLLDLHEGLM